MLLTRSETKVPPPAKRPGRPKRHRILAETAAEMRRDDVRLRKIHRYLNASGVRLRDPQEWQPENPYYQAARLWADSGEASLRQFKASEGQELMDLTLHRFQEAWEMLERIAAGEGAADRR
jgi:hypothetical protein